MKIIEPESYSEIKRFLIKNIDLFPSHEAYFIRKSGSNLYAKTLWTNNMLLLRRYGIGCLFFFLSKDKKIGLSFAEETLPGVLEIGSVSLKGYPIIHYKAANFFLKHIENIDWVRCQALVKEEFFAKILKKHGYEEEGFVRKYDGENDFRLFAKVR